KSLAPGASETFAFEHKVTDADVQRGKVVNEATATGESPDPEKPEVPVDPGKEEDKTQPNPPDSDDDAQDVVKEEETFGFGAGYASVSVYDCCE
ncbi:MAG: hypothetical protein U0J65_00165, partial [Christensenellales bacterium]|nr:hypothetical protein [Christensenellales bacterium]